MTDPLTAQQFGQLLKDLIAEGKINVVFAYNVDKDYGLPLLSQQETQLLSLRNKIDDIYNKSINGKNKTKAKEAFLQHFFDDAGKELSAKAAKADIKKKGEAAFDAMYSFYDCKSTDHPDNKNREITSDVTLWEYVKAFMLYLVKLIGFKKDVISNKELKENYAELVKSSEQKNRSTIQVS